MSQRTVLLELAGDHQLARDLVAGGVFVPETLQLGEPCTLVLSNGDELIEVHAHCVFVAGSQGSGLQLVGCDAEMKQRILDLAARASAAEGVGIATDVMPSPGLEESTLDDPLTDEPRPDEPVVEGLATDVMPAPRISEPVTETLSAMEASELYREPSTEQLSRDEIVALEQEEADDADPERKLALNVHERLRGLTLVQQIKIASKGEVTERIVLERMYGKNVWEALLRNPRITGPEVARISRMGQLPRPLIELIVGNGGWLQIPEVRRALLSNPRLGLDQIQRVLRLLPKHELKLAGLQTAYPHTVRDAAKRLLREMGG